MVRWASDCFEGCGEEYDLAVPNLQNLVEEAAAVVLVPVFDILARFGAEVEGEVGHRRVDGVAVDAEELGLCEVFAVGAHGDELQSEPLEEFVLNGFVDAEGGIV